MIVRPFLSASISPAFWSTEKWADMVGLETAKWSDNSPADIGRLRSSCSTRRRVGSERALNTLFTNLYLANHLTIVKPQFRLPCSDRLRIASRCSMPLRCNEDGDNPRVSPDKNSPQH